MVGKFEYKILEETNNFKIQMMNLVIYVVEIMISSTYCNVNFVNTHIVILIVIPDWIIEY